MKKIIFLAILCFFVVDLNARPVNVNTADAKNLSDSLKGIGAAKAQAIVDYRTKHGEFKTVNDLTKVSGIGEKILEKNKVDILFSDDAHNNTPFNSVVPSASKEVAPKK